ncbi:MAG TPA: KH domain-containing protein [Polyangium sp.]|nr:KH domain-containing protein [Polyangium sp.]
MANASPSAPAMLVNLVRLIAQALVDHPDQVKVREVTGDRFPRIELAVARDDIGKVIGKDGRTAQSIRALVNAAAHKAGTRAYLDILD